MQYNKGLRKYDVVLQVPIGLPVMNSGAYILNDNLEPVDSSGTVGQLFVSSPNLAMGYCGMKTEGKSFIRAEVNDNVLTVYRLSFISLNQ